MRSSIIFFVALIMCQAVAGQSLLKGRVTDSATKKPIPVANIFLSKTSVGTVSHDNGEFAIDAFPPGRYELVISCVGYETFVISLQSDHLPAFVDAQLKPKVIELQEVIVEPYDKDGWDRWGLFFSENFIGTSDFSTECILTNKDALKFRMNKKLNVLRANADEPLVFENKALGYHLKYTLTQFEYNYNTNIVYFQGYTFFEEMRPKRKGQEKRWIQNRKEAYSGSLMQFLRSLYRNKLLEDNFEVRRLIYVTPPERTRVEKLYKEHIAKYKLDNQKISVDGNMGLEQDSMTYYRNVLSQSRTQAVLINRLIPGDSVAYAVDSAAAGFYFTDHLQVVYPNKRTPVAFAKRFSFPNPASKFVTSELFLVNGKPVTVLANGSYFEGVNLLTSGYWGWSEKIGNMLPYDYWPLR